MPPTDRLPLSVRYEEHRLFVSWTPVPTASAYRITARNAEHDVVYDREIQAEGFTGTVELSDFSPLADITYTINVVVIESPFETQNVTTIDLTHPVLTAAYANGGLLLNWTLIEHAETYILELRPGTGETRRWDGLRTSSLNLLPPDDIPLDQACQARVRARHGNAYSPWSASLLVELPGSVRILTQLRDRIINQRTADQRLSLNTAVLPDSGAGANPVLLPLIRKALGVTQIQLEQVAEPVLQSNPDLLMVSAVTRLPTAESAMPVRMVFKVDDTRCLQLEIICELPADWTFDQRFVVLAATRLAYLTMRNSRLIVASRELNDVQLSSYPLKPGLNFYGTLMLPAVLGKQHRNDAAPTFLTSVIGGHVDIDSNDLPQFDFRATATLEPISIHARGYPSRVLQEGLPHLSCTRMDAADGSVNVAMNVEGRLADSSTVIWRQEIPASDIDELHLAPMQPASMGLSSIRQVMRAVGATPDMEALIPAALLDISAFQLHALEHIYPGSDSNSATATATAKPEEPLVSLLPGHPLREAEIVFVVTHTHYYRGHEQHSLQIELTGKMQIGETIYDVAVIIEPHQPWGIILDDKAPQPLLNVLASMIGANSASVIDVFPEFLRGAFSLGLSNVAIWGEPFAGNLTKLGFELAQTQPWPVLPKITLHDWRLFVNVDRQDNTWTPYAILEGQLSLGSGPERPVLDIDLSLPPLPGVPYRIALREGSVVHIPTIGELLGLTNESTVLPTGLTELGGLDINDFVVNFTLLPTPSLTLLSFSMTQAQPWRILPGERGLTVSALSGALQVRLNGNGNSYDASGHIEGMITIAGQQVHVSAQAPSASEQWILTLADNGVHVNGFMDLAEWLFPALAQSSLPSSLPLAHGFIFSGLRISFMRNNGSISNVAFAIDIPNLWTIIENKLSITDVWADISSPYPVVPAEVVGHVHGVVTIAGVHIVLDANKPEAASPWTFSGTLEDTDLEFLRGANDVSAATIAYPRDAAEHGFPVMFQIQQAHVRTTPDTGMFHFDGTAGLGWEFPLGITRLAIRELGGTIDLPSSNAATKVEVRGLLNLAGISDISLALHLGGVENEMILRATLSQEQVRQASIKELANTLAGSGNAAGIDKFENLAPSDLSALSVNVASIYLNLSKSEFIFYGGLRDLGNMALLVAKKPPAAPPDASPWEYFFSISLKPDFTFGALLPSLAVIDGVLKLQTAGFAVFTTNGRTLADVNGQISRITQASEWSLPVTFDHDIALHRGALVYGSLEFPATSVFGNILQLGTPAARANVTISALISRDAPADSMFHADLPDIVVLETIRFTHGVRYPGIHLTYTGRQNRQLDLTGRLTLLGIFGKDYAFDGTFTLNQQFMSATIALATDAAHTTVTPFSLPGIEINSLAAKVDYTFARPDATPPVEKSTRFAIAGQVKMGRAPNQDAGGVDARFDCKAQLVLNGTQPVLMMISLERDFSVGAFITQCVTGDSSGWPVNFIDINFRGPDSDGTPQSRIYYYRQTTDIGSVVKHDHRNQITNYVDGFNVDALIELTFISTITLRIGINVKFDTTQQKYSGIRGSIGLASPVNLWAVELAGNTLQESKYINGPQFELETGSTQQLRLIAGINFLNTAFVQGDASIRKADGKTHVIGHLEAPWDLEPFGKLSCDFEFTRDTNGNTTFRIRNWPDFQWLRDLIQIAEAIKNLPKASAPGGCGELAKLVTKSILENRFNIHPAVALEGGKLMFRLSGSYSMMIRGQQPFLTLDFPASINVGIELTTTYRQLPGALMAAFAHAAKDFASDLLRKPEELALFLAMVYAEDAVEIAMDLVCRSMAEAAVASLTAAAADAVATATLAGQVLGSAACVGIVSDAIRQALEELPPPEEHPPAGPGRPAIRNVDYNDGKLFVQWLATSGAASYTVELQGPDGQIIASASGVRALRHAFTLSPDSLAPGRYIARVRAIQGQMQGEWDNREKVLARPVTSVPQLHYANERLSVLIEGEHNIPITHLVQFLRPIQAVDQPIGAQQRIENAPWTASCALPEPLMEGAYRVRVQSLQPGCLPGLWIEASLDILSLAVPGGVRISYQERKLAITWNPVAGVGITYIVRIRRNRRPDYESARVETTSMQLDADPGEEHVLQVRALSTDHLSNWSGTLSFTPVEVAMPTGVRLTWEEEILVLHWDHVTEYPGYDLLLMDAQNRTIGTKHGIFASPMRIDRDDRAPLINGEQYSVSIVAWKGSSRSAAVVTPPFRIIHIAVEGLSIANTTDGAINAQWLPPSLPPGIQGSLKYNVQLIDVGNPGVPLIYLHDIIENQVILRPENKVTVVLNQAYTVKVQVSVDAYRSNWDSRTISASPPAQVGNIISVYNDMDYPVTARPDISSSNVADIAPVLIRPGELARISDSPISSFKIFAETPLTPDVRDVIRYQVSVRPLPDEAMEFSMTSIVLDDDRRRGARRFSARPVSGIRIRQEERWVDNCTAEDMANWIAGTVYISDFLLLGDTWLERQLNNLYSGVNNVMLRQTWQEGASGTLVMLSKGLALSKWPAQRAAHVLNEMRLAFAAAPLRNHPPLALDTTELGRLFHDCFGESASTPTLLCLALGEASIAAEQRESVVKAIYPTASNTHVKLALDNTRQWLRPKQQGAPLGPQEELNRIFNQLMQARQDMPARTAALDAVALMRAWFRTNLTHDRLRPVLLRDSRLTPFATDIMEIIFPSSLPGDQ